jgi:hypothetical protein
VTSIDAEDQSISVKRIDGKSARTPIPSVSGIIEVSPASFMLVVERTGRIGSMLG